MRESTRQRIASVVAAFLGATLVGAVIWLASRPDDIELPPLQQELTPADTAVSADPAKKSGKTSKKKATPKERRKPIERHFLDENIPSE